MIQKTILLCENLKDGEFYKKIAGVYLKRNNIPKFIYFEYECRGGGGGTIADEYENIQKLRRRWCLCLVDSDKIAPEASLGKTAQGLKEKDNENIVTTTVFILKVREIENLIPRKMLSGVSSGDRNREEALKTLNFLVENVTPDILRFIDIKKGTLLPEIVKDNSDKVRSYWENILDLIPDNSKDISKGFGEKIMKNTIEWLEKERKSSQEIAKMLEPYLESDWDEIGQLILSWCIAEFPIVG